MSLLKDSDAKYDEERLFAQHQAAITLIQNLLDNPTLRNFSWLDVACGKGQIISQLDSNLNSSNRAKIEYLGYDIQADYLRMLERKAGSLGLKSVNVITGEIQSLPDLIDEENKFDFITMTNTIHEFSPYVLPTLLFESIIRLTDDGFLFVYDMETLPTLELGAVPLKTHEIYQIITYFLKALGEESYSPSASQWNHRTCNGWNITLRKRYFSQNIDVIKKNRESAIRNTEDLIREIVCTKLRDCKDSLGSITKFGVENPEEETEKIRLLYDFWALSRVLEV